MAELVSSFVSQRQQYEQQLETIRDFFKKSTEELADLTCELYMLNAEVLTLEDPGLYLRVKQLAEGCGADAVWPAEGNL